MTVQVALTINSDDVSEAVQTVLFALREVLGQTDAARYVTAIEARPPARGAHT